MVNQSDSRGLLSNAQVGLLRQGNEMRYRFVNRQKKAFPVGRLCKLLKVSRSSYYDYLERENSCRPSDEMALITRAREIHWQNKGEQCIGPVFAQNCWMIGIQADKRGSIAWGIEDGARQQTA